jgi:hypothetical protein
MTTANSEGFTLINGKPTIVKDPNAVLDYTWDWSKWLDDFDPDGQIAVHQIIIGNSATAVVQKSESNGLEVTAIIAGGEVGEKISATCRITTDSGLVDDWTLYMKVKEL